MRIKSFLLLLFNLFLVSETKYYANFDYTPQSAKENDEMKFTGFLISRERNKRSIYPTLPNTSYHWYFKKQSNDQYKHLGDGQTFPLLFRGVSSEGIYKLNISVTDAENEEIFTEKYIQNYRPLNVSLLVEDKELASKTTKEFVDLVEGDVFDWSCRICGVPESWWMVKPKGLQCEGQRYNEPSVQCLEFTYTRCRFLANQNYGCTARNVLSDVRLAVELKSRTSSVSLTGSNLITPQMRVTTDPVSNDGGRHARYEMKDLLLMLVLSLTVIVTFAIVIIVVKFRKCLYTKKFCIKEVGRSSRDLEAKQSLYVPTEI